MLALTAVLVLTLAQWVLLYQANNQLIKTKKSGLREFLSTRTFGRVDILGDETLVID